MTEVPEYLLRRSRERRAALGLAPSDGEPAGEGSAPAPAQAAAAPAAAAAAAPAAAPSAPAPSAPPVPAKPPGQPVKTPWPRSGIPSWMMPVLLLLPLWAIVYVGAFGERGGADGEISGAEVYRTAGCAGCHGSTGQGVGAFPALAGGEAALTFPDRADHISWIETGSGPFQGQPYGDPNRPGGQRIATSGGMPGFANSLTPEEIEAVVDYERDVL